MSLHRYFLPLFHQAAAKDCVNMVCSILFHKYRFLCSKQCFCRDVIPDREAPWSPQQTSSEQSRKGWRWSDTCDEPCQTRRELCSLTAAFSFTSTGNRRHSCSSLPSLCLPPLRVRTGPPLPSSTFLYHSLLFFRLIYSLAETSPWIIEMNDRVISSGIHITCLSRERVGGRKHNKGREKWKDRRTGAATGGICAVVGFMFEITY